MKSTKKYLKRILKGGAALSSVAGVVAGVSIQTNAQNSVQASVISDVPNNNIAAEENYEGRYSLSFDQITNAVPGMNETGLVRETEKHSWPIIAQGDETRYSIRPHSLERNANIETNFVNVKHDRTQHFHTIDDVKYNSSQEDEVNDLAWDVHSDEKIDYANSKIKDIQGVKVNLDWVAHRKDYKEHPGEFEDSDTDVVTLLNGKDNAHDIEKAFATAYNFDANLYDMSLVSFNLDIHTIYTTSNGWAGVWHNIGLKTIMRVTNIEVAVQRKDQVRLGYHVDQNLVFQGPENSFSGTQRSGKGPVEKMDVIIRQVGMKEEDNAIIGRQSLVFDTDHYGGWGNFKESRNLEMTVSDENEFEFASVKNVKEYLIQIDWSLEHDGAIPGANVETIARINLRDTTSHMITDNGLDKPGSMYSEIGLSKFNLKLSTHIVHSEDFLWSGYGVTHNLELTSLDYLVSTNK